MQQNVLIVYYTWGRNTHRMAEAIAAQTGGALAAIAPQKAYPASYNATVDQAKKEIREGYRPALESVPDVSAYDVVFVGSPNWWSTIAPPVATFLEGVDLAGKTVVPFCTHGGGGQARLFGDISKLCPGADVRAGLALYGDGGQALAGDVGRWLAQAGLK